MAVQNLSATTATTATVEFMDHAGTVLETQTVENLCPEGSTTFQRNATDGLPGASVGWVQVTSNQTNVAADVSLMRWEGPAQTSLLEALGYPALPASQVEGMAHMFLPGGGFKSREGGGQ